MATEVLGGLIMNICELYLDDVIVYAETAQELEVLLPWVRTQMLLRGDQPRCAPSQEEGL